MDIEINPRGEINTEALDATLRAALGAAFLGLTVGGGKLVLHLTDDAPVSAVEQARGLVMAHDPAQLSPRQQAEKQRQARLQQAREQYRGELLDPLVFEQTNPQLGLLARKIAWLEQELNDLRAT